jgi:hypothetical protein
MKINWLAVASLAVVAGGAGFWLSSSPTAHAQNNAPAKSAVEFTADGKAKQPVGYRKWVFLGSPLTPNDMNDGEASFPEFHNTYMDPESFAYVEEHGTYRDGTVIVKELLAVGSKEQSSGKGYFQGDFSGLEISVKDSKKYPNEPGNWAYFSFGHKYPLKAEAAKNGAASCNSCHEQNATNFVFSGVYPVLNDALTKAKAKKK